MADNVQREKVKGIMYGTWAQYKAREKDPDTLYFITDKGGTIYRGTQLVIPKNVIETVGTTQVTNVGGVSIGSAAKNVHNFVIETFSTANPQADPVALEFSIYSKEALDAVIPIIVGALDAHRIIGGSGTEADPYVYADGKATGTNSGHVSLTDTVDFTTPANNANAATGGKAVTPKGVYDAIQEAIGGIGGAMVFKGNINSESDLPTPYDGYEAGWTYRVNTAGVYVGQNCEVGDLIIAIADSSGSSQSVVAADWTVGQTNLDGAVTIASDLVNNALVLGAGTKTVKALANGTTGQYLRIVGGVPTWVNHPNTDHGIAACTCSTAAATAAKEASLSDASASNFTLVSGAIVAVKFTNAVPASATLNIENTGAKPIYFRDAIIAADVITGGDTATLMYNGTQWQLLSVDKDFSDVSTSGNYDDLVNPAILRVEDTATASTVARVISAQDAPDFTLQSKRIVAVKFNNGISATNPTLNINSTGALPIYWKGTNVAPNAIKAGDIVMLMNDPASQHYEVIGVDRKINDTIQTTVVNGSVVYDYNLVSDKAVYDFVKQEIENNALWWESMS